MSNWICAFTTKHVRAMFQSSTCNYKLKETPRDSNSYQHWIPGFCLLWLLFWGSLLWPSSSEEGIHWKFWKGESSVSSGQKMGKERERECQTMPEIQDGDSWQQVRGAKGFKGWRWEWMREPSAGRVLWECTQHMHLCRMTELSAYCISVCLCV